MAKTYESEMVNAAHHGRTGRPSFQRWFEGGDGVYVDLLEVTISPSIGVVRWYKAFEGSCQIKSG